MNTLVRKHPWFTSIFCRNSPQITNRNQQQITEYSSEIFSPYHMHEKIILSDEYKKMYDSIINEKICCNNVIPVNTSINGILTKKQLNLLILLNDKNYRQNHPNSNRSG